MSLVELAADVMVRGFGPGGPGADDGAPRVYAGATDFATASTPDVADRFLPGRGFKFPPPSEDQLELRVRIIGLVAEGLQELEHASLVRISPKSVAPYVVHYATTRRGRAALERREIKGILEAAGR